MVLVWGYLGAFFAQARSVLWYFSEHTSPVFPGPPLITHCIKPLSSLLNPAKPTPSSGPVHPHLLHDMECEKIPEGNALLLLLEHHPGLCGHVAHLLVTVYILSPPPWILSTCLDPEST